MRQRLDRELAARGLARSRSHAQTMINSGSVSVDGVIITRPAELVETTAQIDADADHYVSRAAHKLLGALDDLGLSVSGRALDAGSSTGGFTQVLLERGCPQVIAIDVGTDQLAPELRRDPRVRALERTNLRDLDLEHVDDQPVDLVVADVSFISLVLLIERFSAVVTADGADAADDQAAVRSGPRAARQGRRGPRAGPAPPGDRPGRRPRRADAAGSCWRRCRAGCSVRRATRSSSCSSPAPSRRVSLSRSPSRICRSQRPNSPRRWQC